MSTIIQYLCPLWHNSKNSRLSPQFLASTVPVTDILSTMKRFTIIALLSFTCTAWMTEAVRQPAALVYPWEWGARSEKKAQALTVNPPPYVIIHHSETPRCGTFENCKKRIQSIQNYHMDEKNWDDIGYNFLIGESRIYEGRGWNIRGAHSPDYNMKSIGICFIGNFTETALWERPVALCQTLLEYGVGRGFLAKDYKLLGHRQTRNTKCPGDALYKMIQTWPHWSEKP